MPAICDVCGEEVGYDEPDGVVRCPLCGSITLGHYRDIHNIIIREKEKIRKKKQVKEEI